MMDKQALHKNFTQPEEKLAFAKVLDNVFICQKQHENVFSDFLDPIKVGKFKSILELEKNIGVHISIFGGNQDAERRMMGFCPDYQELRQEEFPIAAILVSYHTRYSKNLSHRDFLGSILGLGIERSRVGDILLDEGSATVFVHEDMADYICINLEKVGNTKVKVEKKKIDALSITKEEKEETRVTVSSLRLDTVISVVFRISRSKSSELIEGEKVFVNWMPCISGTKQISAQDVITVRGMGRVEVHEILGKSKKDKTILSVYKFL